MRFYKRFQLLCDTTFQKRYFSQHETMMRWGAVYGYDRNKRKYSAYFRFLRFLFTKCKLMFIYRMWLMIRFICGKIDIPYMQIVVTTQCTLKCKDCHDLMPLFKKEQHYKGRLENITKDLKCLLDSVDSIMSVRILGGEPLLFKDLPKLIDYIKNEQKIKSFDIITNATIPISDDILHSLKDCYKARVIIDDYSKQVQSLKSQEKLHHIQTRLKQYDIRHFVLHWDTQKWFSTGEIKKANRTREQIAKNFLDCGMYCVSMIGNMGGSGNIFICPRATSMSKIYGINALKGDFVSLDSKNLKDDLRLFYKKTYFESCDYCGDMSKKQPIEVAIQLD